SWFADMSASVRPGLTVRTQDPANGRAGPVPIDDRPASPPAVRVAATPRLAKDQWLLLGFAIWSVGFMTFATRLAWSWRRIRALLARIDFAVSRDVESQKESLRRELGIHRRVRIATHPEIAAPMCVGLFRPVILWPIAENCPMSSREQRASLTHE